jgi:hypothetical protein
MLFFGRNGSCERRKKAGEEEKGSESQEWDIHTISLAPLVFPLQGVSPPSIAHTPTV